MAKPIVLTADKCEELFYAALAAGDARGVEAALFAMAPLDPHRAQRLLDDLRTALTIVGACRG